MQLRRQSYISVDNAKNSIGIKASRCAKNVHHFHNVANTARLKQLEVLMTNLFVILAGFQDSGFVDIANKKLEYLVRKCADSANQKRINQVKSLSCAQLVRKKSGEMESPNVMNAHIQKTKRVSVSCATKTTP